MQVIADDPNTSILRFDGGEEVMAGVRAYCERTGIAAASFTAIGACRRAICSFYDLPGKEYRDREFAEPLEIAAVIGNVARLGGETVIHAHGVFSRADSSPVAGHIREIEVSATCEVVLSAIPRAIERRYDPETGLNLLAK